MNKKLIFSSLLAINLTITAAARKPASEKSESITLRRSDSGKHFFNGINAISMADYLLAQTTLKLVCTPKSAQPKVFEVWKDKYDYYLNGMSITRKEYKLAQKIETAKKIKFNLCLAASLPETPTKTIQELKAQLDKAVRDIK